MDDGKGDDMSMKLKWLQHDLNGSAVTGSFRSLRIRTKLWLTLVPTVVTILAVTGYVTHWFSRQFLQESVSRTVLLQTLAVAHEYESMMSRCREDLVELSLGPVTEEGLRKKWAHLKAARGWGYVEMGFMDKSGSKAMILAESEEGLERVSLEPGTSLWDGVGIASAETQGPSKGEAGPWVSSIVHVGYRSRDGSVFYGKATHVVRFISRSESRDGQGEEGFFFLSMDARQYRDILSLYNSRRSPLFGFVRSPELRYLYFMDPQGWILFQSEDEVDAGKALNTDTARSGLTGTFGRPGLPFAFRPNVDQRDYWEIVGNIRERKSGVLVRRISPTSESKVDRVYIGYAPILFSRGPDGASLYGAVVFVDRSRLITMAGYRQVDVMFIISLLSSLLVVLLLWGISRVITRPLYQLTAAVNALQESGHLETIEIPDKDLETAMLKEAVNGLIQRLQEQMAALEMQDRQLREMIMRERISLEEECDVLRVEREKLPEPLARLVGQSRAMQRFREFIIRAAVAEADVLIVGETGTGKQLAAEAIHALSRRASQPFVAINCGALDENLLLDALFGHVKGAFSEAKGDRKGAFLAADGGTLFLDEIGTASPKVQQALLRVIAERRVRPLGSDREVPVDVRLVAATNEDLLDLTRRGLFREDLYYRLNVLTLHTPPLRERREDIPLLAAHFLARAGRQFKRPNVSLTQGALEALMAHPWPGNVRELENRLTRAVTMAEGSLIHASDLELDRDPLMNGSDSVDTLKGVLEARAKGASTDVGELGAVRFDEGQKEEPKPSSKGGPSSTLVEINERQRKALEAILERGHMTRAEYQEIVGGGIAPRTALSDLQDLVAKGLLKKTGRGPATRYRLLHRGRLVASGNQTFGGSS
ncbi:MAG: sigma 54-interacting transcriptional regulator [Desulfosoma sp.]